MKKQLFRYFVICFFWQLNVHAQYNVKLTGENQKLKNTIFRVITVKTNDLKSNKTLGQIYQEANKLTDVNVEGGISNAIKKQFTKYDGPKNAPEIVLNVEIFEIKEKLLYGNLIEGKIWLEMAAKIVVDGDTNALCRARSNVKYQRGLSTKFNNNIAEEIRVCLDNGYSYVLNFIVKNKGILESFAESSKVFIQPYKVVVSSDTVYYQQRKVAWTDFKGPIRSKTDYGAAIFASFGYATKLYTEFGQIRMEITPKIFMDKNMSWVRPEMRDAYGLAHEQLHFDIAYLLSLQFLSKIKTFTAKTEKDLLSLVNFEYLEFYKKMHAIQDQYDAETDHSLNHQMQEKWAKKTKAEISAFDINQLYK